MIALTTIRTASRDGRIQWRYHALRRAMERGITREQALRVLYEGGAIKSEGSIRRRDPEGGEMWESLLKRGERSEEAEREVSLMANTSLSLEERLTAHPQLKERIEALLAIVEDTQADVTQADEAERRVIAEVRRLGNEALCSWAAHQEAAQQAVAGQQGAARAGKKNSTGIPRLGKYGWSSNSFGRRGT